MSSHSYRFQPPTRYSRSGQLHGRAYAPNTALSESLPFGAITDDGVTNNSVWIVGERQMIPSTLDSFPGTSPTPVPVILINSITRPRQAITESPPRFINQAPMTTSTQEESILSIDEQKNVLKKLRKEVYNPTPKRIIQRMNLYYRVNGNNNIKNERVDDEDKRCAICLEDFEPKELVVVTPCDHMFHEECIMPWLKSQGRCPVCRFAISDRINDTPTTTIPTNNNSAGSFMASDRFTSSLISYMRAGGASVPLWF